MWSRRACLAVTSMLLAVACGKSTTNSEDSPTGSGGSLSNGSGGGHDGAADTEGASNATTASSGTTANDNEATTPTTATAATNGSTGGTTDADTSSTTNSASAGSGGDAGMTAEEMGCILTAAVKTCSSNTEAVFACPLDAPVPGSCSECFEPMVDPQGHPYNQCSSGLLNGRQCHYCCCEPSHSGCEELSESGSACAAHPSMPRLFLCLEPYEEPSGCTLTHDLDVVDRYCCP